MPSRGTALDNKRKLQILDEIENQEKTGKVSLTSIGKKFDIDRTTVARISKTRESLKNCVSKGTLGQKRKRNFKEEDVDEALHLWLTSKLSQDARINLPLLKTKATELAKEMGHDFVPTDSWLNRFKDRHDWKFKREHGEKQALDAAAAENFTTSSLPRILTEFAADDIFNADETGLYFKGLPDRGYAPTNEKLCGGKKAKERVTVLVCSNMSGTEKRKLLVIGKSKKPRCFPRDLTSLPVTYRQSTNAWMTGNIFKEHLEAWNATLISSRRQILLLLDNCSAHPPDLQFSNITIHFLPPNTTSAIQPMDMGVIKTLKSHYRKRLNTRIIAELDANESKKAAEAVKAINLCDAIHMLSDAWKDVTIEAIKNCFRKAGFKMIEGDNDMISEEIISPPDNLTREEFEAMVDQDRDLEVCGVLTDSDIVAAVKKQKLNEDEEEDEDETKDSEPTSQELIVSVNTLRQFLQRQGKETLMTKFKDIEKEVYETVSKKKKQSTLDAYLQ